MGTSVSQRSPETPNWDLAQSAYEDPNVPLDLALRHIWRASDSDGAVLSNLLSAPIVAEMGLIAARAGSSQEAIREATKLIVSQRASSLATDIARRAVAQCAGQPNAEALYAKSLFAEATNYLISRDVSGFVKPGMRIGNVADSLQFKKDLMKVSQSAVEQVNFPTNITHASWSGYVQDVVARFKRRS